MTYKLMNMALTCNYCERFRMLKRSFLILVTTCIPKCASHLNAGLSRYLLARAHSTVATAAPTPMQSTKTT